MPAKNSVKLFAENSFYHIYNRGIDKNNIFIDKTDYNVFLELLKRYLIPPEELKDEIKTQIKTDNDNTDKVGPWRIRHRTDLHDKIKLISYCLMPNHFHLMVKQSTRNAITDLMRALSNSYVIYFNNKYNRIGPLFTGKYKAALVEGETYLLHLTRYIHLNPVKIGYAGSNLANYRYSSYKVYLNRSEERWIYTDEILAYFKSSLKINSSDILSYQSFVEDYPDDSNELLEELTLESE